MGYCIGRPFHYLSTEALKHMKQCTERGGGGGGGRRDSHNMSLENIVGKVN